MKKEEILEGFKILGLSAKKDEPFNSPEEFARQLVSKIECEDEKIYSILKSNGGKDA